MLLRCALDLFVLDLAEKFAAMLRTHCAFVVAGRDAIAVRAAGKLAREERGMKLRMRRIIGTATALVPRRQSSRA